MSEYDYSYILTAVDTTVDEKKHILSERNNIIYDSLNRIISD